MPPPLPLYAFLCAVRDEASGTTIWAPGLSTDRTLYNRILAYENDPDVAFPSFKTTGFGEYTKEAKENMADVDGEHGGIKVTARGADIGRKCKLLFCEELRAKGKADWWCSSSCIGTGGDERVDGVWDGGLRGSGREGTISVQTCLMMDASLPRLKVSHAQYIHHPKYKNVLMKLLDFDLHYATDSENSVIRFDLCFTHTSDTVIHS
jgi:hypothetical protein